MVQARKLGTDREAALRRVAIVLSSLPAPIASQLLGSIDPDSKQLLRRTMTSLSDVDPLERQRALQAFKGSFQQHPGRPAQPLSSVSPDGSDEISISGHEDRVRQATSRVVPSRDVVSSRDIEQELRQHDDPPASSLGFLHDVDDDTLVGLLRGEHPQTIALVLASIAPPQAARVLPALDSTTQREALGRIGRLGETPPDVMDEIASHLRGRIQQQEAANVNRSGQRALNAILAAMPERPQTAASPPRNPEPVIPQTTQRQAAPTQRQAAPTQRQAAPIQRQAAPIQPAAPNEPAPIQQQAPIRSAAPIEPSSRVESITPVSTDLSAVDQTHRLRLVAETWQEESESDESDDPDSAAAPATNDDAPIGADSSPAMAQQRPVFPSTDAIHQHLISLSPEELCAALGKVSTRRAMLALCGLPNEVAEGVMSVLPRAHAKQVRREMASLQSLQLREIDEAKEAVAAASVQAHTSVQSSAEQPAGMAA